MIRTRLSTLFSIFIVAISLNENCIDFSDWDYQTQPFLPYSINHLELDLILNPMEGEIGGVAEYSVNAKSPGQTQIVMHASGLDISSVLYNGNETEFAISSDSLIIQVEDTLSITQESLINITWGSRTIYGAHKDRFGTFWSSLNPKSVRHWLPTYDHPLVAFSVDAELTIPAELDVISNGIEVSDELLSADFKKVGFAVDTPIPVTGLNFAVGNFEYMDAQSGIHKVQVLTQKGLITDDQHQELLNIAVSSKRALENALEFEFPWESLNVVVLEDGYWDVRNDAAGIIYVAENKGSLATQLQRGLVSQWFGQYQRVYDFERAAVEIEFLKQAAFELAGFERSEISNVYQIPSLEAWNLFANCCEETNEFYKKVVEQSIPDLIKNQKGALRFSYYSDYWYDKTGIDFEDWNFGTIDEETEPEKPQVLYQIDVEHDEVESRAIVIANSETENNGELQSLWLISHAFGNVDSTEITFTGAADTILVDIPNATEYVTFKAGSTTLSQIEFGTFPVFFLTAQLGSSEIPDRKLAAKLLKAHTDNPDLQLALRDALDMEQDPGVKAELLKTMGLFTNGATGTEQQFLSELNNSSEEIQKAALISLGNYQEDESVSSSLRSVMIRTESEEIFSIAMESFLNVSNTEIAVATAQRLMNTDTTGNKPLQLLEIVAAGDTTDQSRSFTQELISTDYSAEIRLKALDLLLNTATDADYWSALIVDLSSDFDPRVRTKVLEALKFLSDTDAENIEEAISFSEFDPRVMFE